MAGSQFVRNGLRMAELLTTSDLRELGLSKNASLSRAGLIRIDRGLYVRGAPTWSDYLAAALRIADTGGITPVAYGASALCLVGLAPEGLPVEVLGGPSVQQRNRSWARFVRPTTPRRRLIDLDPPRTSLEDAVLDHAADVDETDACALLTRVLQERVRVPETDHRSDGAYVAKRILVELDGVEYHDEDADRRLDLEHALLGYTTLRINWGGVTWRRCATAAYVGRALGIAARCPSCSSP